MNSRRTFLKTVLLSTGAVFAGLPLGCGKEEKPLPLPDTLVERRRPLSASSQRFRMAHSLMKDKTAVILNPARTLDCDVVIVGAGASGLAAARRLQKSGFSAILLENEPQAGGAGVHGEWNGVKFPLGSVYFVELDKVREFLDEAGTKILPTPEDAILMKGEIFHDYWRDDVLATLPISSADKAAMKRFREDFRNNKKTPEYPLKPHLSPALAKLDAMSVRQFLSRYNSKFLTDFMDLYTRSSMGGSIDETNAYCFQNFYSAEFGASFGQNRYSFPGGLHGLTAAMQANVGHSPILFEQTVFALRNTASGVEVLAMDESGEVLRVRAAAAILATQKYMAPHLIPDMPDTQKKAISSLKYSPYMTVHLCSREELFPHKVFDAWTVGGNGFLTDILNPNSMVPKNAGQKGFVYSVYSPRPSSDRDLMISEAGMAQIARSAAEQAVKLLGKNAGEAIEEIQCFGWGHNVIIPGVGTHNGIAQTASRPVGKIVFANTDNYASPAIENAILSGVSAAETIGTMLGGKKG